MKKASMKQWRAICLLSALIPGVCASAVSEQSHAEKQHDSGLASNATKRGRDEPTIVANTAGPEAKSPIGLDQALYLIRATLLTLNDANRSGNYSVLRDLASPGLQSRYNPADLAQIFAALRESRVDLSVVALAAPQLSQPPKLESDGELHLIGSFVTQPRRINFDLLFQIVEGRWKWLAMSVTAPDAPGSAATGAGQ